MMHNVHSHYPKNAPNEEYEMLNRHCVPVCLYSPNLSSTSAKMASADLDFMCVAHSWLSERL